VPQSKDQSTNLFCALCERTNAAFVSALASTRYGVATVLLRLNNERNYLQQVGLQKITKHKANQHFRNQTRAR